MTGAPHDARRSLTSILELLGILLLTVCVPLVIRLADGATPDAPPRLPYLPVLEGQRQGPFHGHRIPQLQRLEPGYVVIGDSMAGTRINERLLGQLSGSPVAPLLQAGSGPVFWYLAMKNWVIASGIKPRVVFIFFRDTNLTDTMFRLDEQFGWSLDSVTTDRVEDEVNAIVASAVSGPWFRLHRVVDHAYHAAAARRLVDPAVSLAPATWLTSSRRRQAELLNDANARFGLEHLRVMESADMAADPGTDFDSVVSRSVLPLLLRDSATAGFQLCLVRVQRRPVGRKPPVQPFALQQYMADLRRYVEARGGILHDDTGDPELTLEMYGDGDHISKGARDRYTTLFFERLRPLFNSTRASQ
jgi:hypothetical protein